MNIKLIAQAVGGVVLLLGIVGLFAGETQLFGLMNTDIMLDLTRIALGAILIGSSFADEGAVKTAFAIFGLVYLGAFVGSLISPTLFGILPSGVDMIDHILHLGGGILGVALAFVRGESVGERRGRARTSFT